MDPSIGEKVQFWQEQDHINKLLIPRVLHTHQLLMDLTQKGSLDAKALAKTEAGLRGTCKELSEKIDQAILGTAGLRAEVLARVASIENAGKKVTGRLNQLELAVPGNNQRLETVERNLRDTKDALQEDLASGLKQAWDFATDQLKEKLGQLDVSLEVQKELRRQVKFLKGTLWGLAAFSTTLTGALAWAIHARML